MPLDPSILLQSRVPDASVIANPLYQLAAQRREEPFRQQQLQMGEQKIDAQARANERQSFIDGAIQLDNYLKSDDVEGAKRYLQGREKAILARGGNPNDTQDVLRRLEAGDTASVKSDVKSVLALNNLQKNNPAGLQEIVGKLQGAGIEPGSDEYKKAFRVALGLDARAVTSAPKTVDIGGVPYTFDPTSKSYVPVETDKGQVTADTVATSESTIAAAKTEAIEKVKAEIARRTQQEGQANKVEDADRIYKVLTKSDLGKIYGRGESLYPSLLRSQEGIDMIANRDQLVSMLSLAARGELRGQGQISDSEQKILRQAVSILENPDISPEIAKAALDSAMNTIYRNAGRDFSPPQGTQEVPIEDLVKKYAQ